jgi:6-phosphogluconolactonase
LKDEINSVKDKFNLVLSGGSTPKYLFRYLSNYYHDKIQWNKINFFWSDERCVPPDSDESNYKMAFENLLSKVGIPQQNIFRIRGEDNPVDEAGRYSEVIRKNVKIEKGMPVLDLVMLGIGEDGHTASIFPDQLQLLNDDKIYSDSVQPVTGQRRITITGKVINCARNIVFIVTGKSKSKIAADIVNNKSDSGKYPASFVKPVKGKLIWLLDRQAASLLE